MHVPPRRDFAYAPPPDDGLRLIHRDDDLLVVDKPAGLLCVPGKTGDLADCLQTRAQAEFPSARTVHRLDMDTSGILVMALNSAAHRHLGLQFERRKLHKTYTARVWGRLAEDEGHIDLPLTCDWPNRPLQMIDHERGRKAETGWRVLAREENATRVALFPKTGRSHQLRVHMLSLGHPILGDRFYAHDEALHATPRLQLHASELTLHHPADGRLMTFQSEVPF